MFKNINKENLFHAYVCSGGSREVEAILEFVEHGLGMPTSNNQDLFVKHYDAFGIDDSREITRLAQLRPVGERKVLCISANKITHEAQDALLKLFEEPPLGTHFFLILPNVSLLRATLLSRVQVLEGEGTSVASDTATQEASDFLKASYKGRLDIVAKIAKDKDRDKALGIVNELERILAREDLRDGSIRGALRAVELAQKYLPDNGSMLKQLMEVVAVSLPSVKVYNYKS